MNIDINDDDVEITVNSINNAKNAVRAMQEMLFEDPVDSKKIFRATVMLNEYLDEVALQIHENRK